jgi:DNA polymerase III epsilon subunit-like protein
MTAPDSQEENIDRVMVDIETLGLERGAAILSIGAVRFGPGRLGDQYEGYISLSSCQEAGLKIDADTLEWWLDQDEEARKQLTKGIDIREVLRSFSEWYGDADEVWANSPSFDCELLEHAFDAVGMEAPWEFYEERDYRTVKSLSVAPDTDHKGVEHDALDDAKHQAYVAAAALSHLDGVDWPHDAPLGQRGATGDD